MTHLHGWIRCDAMGSQRLCEAVAGEFCGVLNGDAEAGGFTACRDGSKSAQECLVGLAVETEMLLRPGRRSDGFVLQSGGVIRQPGVPTGDGRIASSGARGQSQVVHVVIDGERGDGCAVIPLQIILTPSLAVTFVDEESIVGPHGSVECAKAACGHLRGEIVERMKWRIGSFGVAVVRISASG